MKRTLSQRRRSETSLSAEQRKPPYRMTSIRRQALFSEQVAVRPGAGQGQHQHFILDAVDQQSIREDMTFTVSDPISGQRVILVLFGEHFTHCKGGDHFLQQFDFQATLHSQLEILFELRGGLDGVLCFLMLSGLQRVHPDRCTLSRTDLLQSFLPPTWRQSFPCWAD